MQTEAGRDHLARVLFDPNSTGTGVYAPACWLAVSESAAALTGSETFLTGEIIDGSLVRGQTTLVHTAGSPTCVVMRTLVSDRDVTIRKAALFNADDGGTLCHIELFSEVAQLQAGDILPVAMTINIASLLA